jgi:hypothetical protein
MPKTSRQNTAQSPRLPRDAARLVKLCQDLHASGSRLEDQFWEKKIDALLGKLFKSSQDSTLESALEHLSEHHPDAFEVLLEQIETRTESFTAVHNEASYDALLVTAPLAVWTRYQLPKGLLSNKDMASLISALKTFVFAPDVQVAAVPHLIGLDEMPRSFVQTWVWLHRLGQRAIDHKTTLPVPNAAMELPGMLADARHLVMAVAVPEGAPIFRWQSEDDTSRERCLHQWKEASNNVLTGVLAGCQFETLIPDAYYVSMRDADKKIRPIAIKAASHWLQNALDVPAGAIRATIIGMGEHKADEYRVGYSLQSKTDVIYGTVWPVFGREDIPSDTNLMVVDTVDEIAAVLRESGIRDIRRIPDVVASAYCEDCGAPLFPNPLGELVHAELPEEAVHAPAQFH